MGGIWGLKSKVPTLAELPPSLTASIALRAIGAPRVTIEVDALVLGQLGADGRLHRRQVPAVDVDLLPVAGEGLLHPVAAGLQLDLALLLDDAQEVLVALVGGPLARGLAGQALVRAEVRQRARLCVVADAGVEGDHRDAGVDGLLHRRRDRRRVGQGDRDAVDLGVDRALDQGGLLAGVRVGRVLELDVVLGRGGLGALADDVPEGVAGGAVGDHGDRHLGRVRLPGVGAGGGRLLLLAAGVAAGGRRQQQHGQQRHADWVPTKLDHADPPFCLVLPARGSGAGWRPRVAPAVVVHPTSSQRDVGNPSSTAESRGTGQRVVTTLPRV